MENLVFFREKEYGHIIIYGAGMVGGLVYESIKAASCLERLIGFAVSRKTKEQVYHGLPVYEISELEEYKVSALVIIATLPELQDEIKETLSQYRFQHVMCMDKRLYRVLEKQYIQNFVVSHPIRQKKLDVLFMASDNNCSSGAFLCMADLCVELSKNGVSVLVVLPEYGNGEQVLADREVEFTYIASEHWAYFCKKSEWEEKNAAMAENENAIKEVEQLLEKYHVKIVHNNTTYTYVGAIAAFRKKIPVIWHLRENIHMQGFEFVNADYAIETINQSDKILAVSEYIKLCMDKLDVDKVRVVYDGIDTEKYLIKRRILETSSILTITMVGAIASHKGQKELIEAAHILRKKKFDKFLIQFIGKGTLEDIRALERLVKEYHLEEYVFFLGRQDDVKQFYSQTDIVVVCSKAEPFGRVTVEAQLAGCLVIGADTGATAELIRDGETGCLYRQGECEDLADKIIYAAAYPELSKKIALAGQKHASEAYTKEGNAAEILRVYRDILDGAGGTEK